MIRDGWVGLLAMFGISEVMSWVITSRSDERTHQALVPRPKVGQRKIPPNRAKLLSQILAIYLGACGKGYTRSHARVARHVSLNGSARSRNSGYLSNQSRRLCQIRHSAGPDNSPVLWVRTDPQGIVHVHAAPARGSGGALEWTTRTFDPCFFQTPPRGGSPCIITRPSPPSGWPEDLHLQGAEPAQHATKALRTGEAQARGGAPQERAR